MTEFSRTTYNFNDRIKINDKTDTTKYILSSNESIADTIANNLEEDRPSDMGIIDFGVQMGKGLFEYPVILYANSLPNMHQLIQNVKEAFHPDLLEADATYGTDTSYEGYHPWKWTEDVGGTSMDFQVFLKAQEVPKIASDDMAGLIRECELKLKANDPRKYSQTQTTLTGAGTATNDGTIPTPVEITIDASGATSTSLTITNDTTSESIYVTSALSAGESLVLDTRDHSALLDGSAKRSYIGNNTIWFMLEPGDNTISISNNANTTIELAWYDAYPL